MHHNRASGAHIGGILHTGDHMPSGLKGECHAKLSIASWLCYVQRVEGARRGACFVMEGARRGRIVKAAVRV